MVLIGLHTCREYTVFHMSKKNKKTMVLQILAILVRVAADHLKNAKDFCTQSRRKALKYCRKRFRVGSLEEVLAVSVVPDRESVCSDSEKFEKWMRAILTNQPKEVVTTIVPDRQTFFIRAEAQHNDMCSLRLLFLLSLFFHIAADTLLVPTCLLVFLPHTPSLSTVDRRH